MDEEYTEARLFVTFEKHQEFLDKQQSLLSLDLFQEPEPEENRREEQILKNLCDILDEYQEQSYLLDPFLEQLVTPVAEALKAHARNMSGVQRSTAPTIRVARIALLLYSYIKFRGYKTIIRFFPHEIADLTIALEYILSPYSPVQDPAQWPLRYAVLLWLSLICMIPFDLDQFDKLDHLGETAAKIEAVGKSYLGNAGLEREGAAILLSRLYTRKDTSVRFPAFLEWSLTTVKAQNDHFIAIGLMHVLCEVAKSGFIEQVQSHLSAFLDISNTVQDSQVLMSNTLTRKLRTKLLSRTVLRLLPARNRAIRRRVSDAVEEVQAIDDEEADVPEEVESILEELFKTVQDKDTVVRWSAAKGIARISERLPTEFAEQVLDNVISLFAIHSMAAATLYDMPSIAEGTWHGACLACAEMARRGLIPEHKLSELVDWLCKALYFDIRKGSHSIGSNVRDAACYVLWSLARIQDVSALAPYAGTLSERLVAVSVFDREINIRRAASATFQEYVGRTGLFAHGINVLRKTDFYSVGIRRNAFLVAAPEVAEHTEYRSYLMDHLLTTTLRHWDPAMRQLGAQALRAICQLDLPSFGPNAARRAALFLKGPDIGDIHGALLTLTELAAAYRVLGEDMVEERRKIFSWLSDVPSKIIESPRHELITAAACDLIANSITLVDTRQENALATRWSKIVDVGLKSRSPAVQEAAASAMAAVSQLVDCSALVDRLIREFTVRSSAMQQSLCRVLGVLDYNAHSHRLTEAVRCLLSCVDKSALGSSMNVEARRNAYASMPQILANVVPRLAEHLTPSTVCRMVDALQEGLGDYTSDERGDVGSWIRVACVQSLTAFAEILFSHSEDLPAFAQYFPASKYHDAVGGILKQGVERLDNVRQQAGECFIRLILLPLPKVGDADAWRIHKDAFVKSVFLSESETIGWNDGERLFPKAVQLLNVERYRERVLAGLIMSVSTRTDSTQRPVSASLISYALQLPVVAAAPHEYDLRGLVRDLIAQASSNLSANNVVVPVLQTVNVLLEADALERLSEDPEGLASLRKLLSIASRNVPRLKNHQRIIMSMRIVANLLPVASLRQECIDRLPDFLTHQYPKVRAETAEHLYVVLQSKDLGYETDEVENVLLEAEWMSSDLSAVQDAARECVDLLAGRA
ncbi:TBCD protein [Laetiporus sulphureus 93-53]|uniref:TBCD protein n=1 Tax=Laetiporus sulphureus 93-53 TaxID=1314785 RepID=A0A165HQ53_9APHY|nr:TBCD protein [Laetiporus sulphureus 93-53]KZT12037.1 TBCD protein [Laetiporus sulphureus 93-53]